MKKLISLLIFIFSFAKDINNDILLIESKLYPKILYLMDDYEYKRYIKIAIVINRKTKNIGIKLKKLLDDKNLKVSLIRRITFNYDAYIFTIKDINKNIINLLLENKKVIFTIYPNYVENAMFSIYIGPKIYLYINPKLLNRSKIKFNPIILKVGKIYEK